MLLYLFENQNLRRCFGAKFLLNGLFRRFSRISNRNVRFRRYLPSFIAVSYFFTRWRSSTRTIVVFVAYFDHFSRSGNGVLYGIEGTRRADMIWSEGGQPKQNPVILKLLKLFINLIAVGSNYKSIRCRSIVFKKRNFQKN